jgi:hypothetical protein
LEEFGRGQREGTCLNLRFHKVSKAKPRFLFHFNRAAVAVGEVRERMSREEIDIGVLMTRVIFPAQLHLLECFPLGDAVEGQSASFDLIFEIGKVVRVGSDEDLDLQNSDVAQLMVIAHSEDFPRLPESIANVAVDEAGETCTDSCGRTSVSFFDPDRVCSRLGLFDSLSFDG